jgi:hypothetical protein
LLDEVLARTPAKGAIAEAVARSLRQKRMSEAARSMPLAGQVLGSRDALGYEAGWLTMQHTARRFLVRWLVVPGSGTASRSLAVWWRWRGKLCHWLSR